MSGLCGWLTCDARGGDAGIIDGMAQVLCRHDDGRASQVLGRRGALAAAAIHAADAHVHRAGYRLVAIWGRPRFADPAAAALAERENPAAAFARHGYDDFPRCLAGIAGAFALAAIDEARGEVLLAVDRGGIRPLIYTPLPGGIVFASNADAIARHPAADRSIDWQSLYHYVYFHMVPGPATIYAAQRRLLPGEYLRLRGGAMETGRYWQMVYEEERKAPFAELKARFVGLLREGVADAAAGAQTGCFLSGGTDSSTVAGMLGRVSGTPARSYSIGFAAEGYDEMQYARIAARHFGTDHHEYYVTPDDVADAIPRLGEAFDQPFGNSSAVPTYYCARMARQDGVDRLLGGDGGDELFGGNERYATQHVFSLYGRLPQPLRGALIEPLATLFPESIGVVRRARSYIRQANTPMPDRTESWNLLERFGSERVFTPAALARIDTGRPLALLRAVWQDAQARAQVNRMLALDLKFTLADNDLPKVERPCEMARVDVAFPMMDDRLVAFSATLEPSLKLRGTKLRWFFKEALRDFLPAEIIAKQKHGFGLPFGPWYRDHKRLRDLVDGSLADLKKRDLVRPEFIDELHGHVADHAGYYGSMVWVLLMLEQWLQARRIALS